MTVGVVSYEDRTVGPVFLALSILFIVNPVALIATSVKSLLNAISLDDVIDPFSFVYVTVCMDYATIAVSFSIEEEPIIPCSVLPNDYSFSIAEIGFGVPLSLEL